MATRYGRSPWVDTFPKSRIPAYPQARGPLKADVAIIGGGLTGCATAYAFAAAGIKVALFEAEQLGRGSSTASTGWLADDPGVGFQQVEDSIGLRAARHAWQAWRRASLDFAALLKRLDIKCRLEPHGSLLVAMSPEEATRLTREKKVRQDAGLDASVVNARMARAETALGAVAALRSRDGATLDPYRAALGLAAAARARGAQIFERSPITKVTFTRKSAAVTTPAGSLNVSRIVVATGTPTPLFRSLRRHVRFESTYLALTEPIPAKIRRRLGPSHAVVRDCATPPHVIRWVDDDRLLIAGADQATAPPRRQAAVVVQRTGQLMYELSVLYPDISGLMPAYGWESAFARTGESLPYIGPHRNFPFHLFAFGDSSQSVTGAYLASRILLRHHLGDNDAADEAFGFHRV